MSKTVFKFFVISLCALFISNLTSAADLNSQNTQPIYLQALINTEQTIELGKSTIFDASPSFISDPTRETIYKWDFGDGNRNEGIEVLHAYKQPGLYTITLTIDDGVNSSTTSQQVYVYKKLIFLLTDQTESQDRIKIIQNYAEKNGVFIKTIDSFGSSTEFISEEILTKKINEEIKAIQKASDIVTWTKGNSGLNALSRLIQGKKTYIDLRQKSIIVLQNNIKSETSRIQRQFDLIKPKNIIIAKEGEIDALINTKDSSEFLSILKDRGSEFEVITEKSGKIRPWNFMSYFVNVLINNGIPDNTIALLLLLPVIATVVAFMRQVVGVTTFGIYTPSIITLSFLIIGIYVGLLTLFIAILSGYLTRQVLKKVRMLFIPKMAIVITVVSLVLLLVLIVSIDLKLFDASFLSIAIFPMLILSALVEKFISSKEEKSFASATVIMVETVGVSIIAYFIAGGEIDLIFTSINFEFIKSILINYPETVFLLLAANIFLGKWTGLRILERARFREILRHIEE